MAVPQGNYTVPDTALSSVGTGCYVYAPSISQAQFFAGSFFIDTGIDDPVAWTSGVDAAEVYAGRVYCSVASEIPGPGTGAYSCQWNIAVTPVWRVSHANNIGGGTQRRILLKCDAYVTSPYRLAHQQSYRLDSVDWTLYRI